MASIKKRNGKWNVRIRKAGFAFQSRTFASHQAALAWSRQVETKIEQGIACLPDKAVKLGDLLKRYKDTVTIHKKSRRDESGRIERLLKDPLSAMRLVEISPAQVTAFKDRRLPDGARTTHYDMTVMRHCIEVARHQWGYFLASNPFDAVKKPKLNNGRQRRVSNEELERLKAASSSSYAIYLWPIIEFALATGMRQSEMTALRWEDVDFAKRLITVRDTKNGDNRWVPMSKSAVESLSGLNRNTDRVFNTTSEAVRQSWRKLINRAGIIDLHFHDLRHEAISRMFENGLSTPEVAAISGHRTVAQLFRYAHADVLNTVLEKNSLGAV